MSNSEYDPPANTSSNSHLGFRLAVGLVGLLLLVMVVMLGRVSMQQSATAEALETRDNIRSEAQSGPARE